MHPGIRSAHALLIGTILLVLAGCASGPSPGAAAPAFSAVDQRGETVSLAALEGRVVVLDFWATWCPPCRVSSPAFQRLHEDLADESVVVLGIHYDDKGDPAAYMREHGYTFATVLDGRAVVAAYGVTRIPTVIVVDGTGTVVHRQVGFAAGDEAAIARVARAHVAAPE